MKLSPLLTLTEVSDFLRMKPETIYVLINKEGFPAIKVGGRWRFDQKDIRTWIQQRRNR